MVILIASVGEYKMHVHVYYIYTINTYVIIQHSLYTQFAQKAHIYLLATDHAQFVQPTVSVKEKD